MSTSIEFDVYQRYGIVNVVTKLKKENAKEQKMIL